MSSAQMQRREMMRQENERVKRQNEARIARRRAVDEEVSAEERREGERQAMARRQPVGPSAGRYDDDASGGSNALLRILSGKTSGTVLVVLLVVLGIILVAGGMHKRGVETAAREAARQSLMERRAEDEALKAQLRAEALAAEEARAAAALLVDPPPTPDAPGAPGQPQPPPLPNSPQAPPRALARWDALRVPSMCQMEDVLPTGIIAGLDLHDRAGGAFVFNEPAHLSEDAQQQESEIPTLGEGLAMAEEERLQDQEVEAAEIQEERIDEFREEEAQLEKQFAVGDQESAATIVDEATVEELAYESAAEAEREAAQAAVEPEQQLLDSGVVPVSILGEGSATQSDYPLRKRSRKMLGEVLPNMEEVRTALVERRMIAVPASGPHSEITTTNPFGFTTEEKLVDALVNVTEFDASCQFVTRECGDSAALQLAAALRADAEAVTNPQITAEELRAVSANLAWLHSNTRTMLNASDLPSLEPNGGLGTCALVTDAEYTSEGYRYDASISRFASVIDKHDAVIHCANGKHYCTITLQHKGKEYAQFNVRLDAQSYLLAVEAGERMHQIMSSDPALADGVANWGVATKPTHGFVVTLMLLRSAVCTRVAVYGQPGVPLTWYRSAGLGHLVVAPGPEPEELELAKTLVQERFFHRVAMAFDRMCFYK